MIEVQTLSLLGFPHLTANCGSVRVSLQAAPRPTTRWRYLKGRRRNDKGLVLCERVYAMNLRIGGIDCGGKTNGSKSPNSDQVQVIWRCSRCGALVHPADELAPAAWCARCRVISVANRDG